jgi:hypothetical protein
MTRCWRCSHAIYVILLRVIDLMKRSGSPVYAVYVIVPFVVIVVDQKVTWMMTKVLFGTYAKNANMCDARNACIFFFKTESRPT